MIDLDYAGVAQRLARFFRRKGADAATADDLVQDTWVQLLSASSRGSVQGFGIGFVYKTGWFVMQQHWRRASRVEECCGDFSAETRVIQLYPEGGGEGMCRHHPDREAVPGKTQCQECLDALKAQAEKRKAAGKCRSHPARDAVPGRTRCQECLDRGNRKNRKPKQLEAA